MANTRAVALCLFTLTIHGVMPDRAWAQCGGGYWSVRSILASRDVSAVFSGTVAGVQALDAVQLVTFDVDGIWKGDVGKRAFVYRPSYKPPPKGSPTAATLSSGGPRSFEIGQRYLVMANLLSDQEKAEFKVEAKPGSLAVDSCGGGSRPFKVFANNDLKEMGPGRKPQ